MCLWGSSSTNAAGTTITAGLPNIKGTFRDIASQTFGASGAVYPATNSTDGCYYQGHKVDTSLTRTSFDASKSNSIYGASTTVQPPAFVVNIWKRTS